MPLHLVFRAISDIFLPVVACLQWLYFRNGSNSLLKAKPSNYPKADDANQILTREFFYIHLRRGKEEIERSSKEMWKELRS